MKEIWKKINGFENYMVSNYGRIKDLNYRNSGKEKILNISDKIRLKINDKRVARVISNLVARAFIEDCPKGDIVVINIDGDEKNNNINNLKVMTKEEYGKISGKKGALLIDRDKLEKDFIDKFNSKWNGEWEYISGYETSCSQITIRHTQCGTTRTIQADNAVRKGITYITCDTCDKFNLEENFNKTYEGKFKYIKRLYKHNNIGKDIHIIECLECGLQLERKGSSLYNAIREHKDIRCECELEEIRLEKEIKRELNKLNKEIKEVMNRNKRFEIEVNRIRECKVCGGIFIADNLSQVCCSKECMRKNKNRRTGLDRRIKNKEQIDKDITLDKLIKRDKGICQICGKPIDEEDCYYTEEGYFIVGNNYPSIDHIKPLAKDGVHTWDNIQLAHMICNSIKKDNYNEEVS